MRKVTNRQIRSILSECEFDANRPLMRSAIDASNPQYCRLRAKEFVDEFNQTNDKQAIINAIELLALSLAMAEVEKHNAEKREQKRLSKIQVD